MGIFLDLKISIVDRKIEFDIYRKPPPKDILIPSDSTHPWSQKISSLSWLMKSSFLRRVATEEGEKATSVGLRW